MTLASPTISHPELIADLRTAVLLRDPTAIAERIRERLERVLHHGGLELSDRYRRPTEGSYARRLFHRDEELDWTAVVMTWAPGQRTPLHDHDGCWCVEGVVEGEIEVTRYELVGEEQGLFCFRRHETLHAAPGSAGSLIPPHEHHVLGNASDRDIAVTLHVYQGAMSRCAVFEPAGTCGDGTALYQRRERVLGYTD